MHTTSLSTGSPQTGITVAVLVAAVLHAGWNALAHSVRDKLVGFVLIGASYAAVSAALLPWVDPPDPAARPWLAASAGLHVLYSLLLMQSFRVGEFGQVYPLARGVSPLVVAAVAVGLLGEPVVAAQLAGIVTLSAGLATLVLAGGRPRGPHRGALGAAGGTGLAIAAYTIVDGIGVRRSGSVAGYAGWLFLLQGSVVVLIGLRWRGPALARQARPHIGTGLAGGLLSLAAYGLVLWAQTRGALAAVAALRETSVIVGTVIGTLAFHEPFGRTRLIATVLVATGIVLLNLG
jgi:drug/metabolite transporter (DMT)-like permease